jgi:hypothetical protein
MGLCSAAKKVEGMNELCKKIAYLHQKQQGESVKLMTQLIMFYAELATLHYHANGPQDCGQHIASALQVL